MGEFKKFLLDTEKFSKKLSFCSWIVYLSILFLLFLLILY